MRLRAMADAIVIGARTLRVDNPKLTIRGLSEFSRKQPLRVVLTRSGDLPRDAHLFTDRHRERTRVYQRKPLRTVLRELGREGITCVLIEGGGRVMGEAFDRKLVDEVHFHLAPLLSGGPDVIGGRGAGSNAESTLIEDVRYTRVGDDLHVSGFTRYASAD